MKPMHHPAEQLGWDLHAEIDDPYPGCEIGTLEHFINPSGCGGILLRDPDTDSKIYAENPVRVLR